MGKILAIDFGLKRTGLAISDAARFFAFGLETVNSENLMSRLKELVASDGVDTFVLGLPMRLNTDDTHITENVRMLAQAIAEEFPTCKIELLDERFTSKMAAQSMHIAGASKKQKQQKELIDKVSATLILQSFLEQSN
ncbi:MAG: Holliday junction DNA helicase RuvA [Bacteroidetes bacterium RIFCSPHIGHO2_02_FULL_44_7]|nr:MAG: Holliday junction DNA helicase RuvA [Bacteroidetes bacterium RIFCSPHIGHO2_02_FULL_44_7]